MNKTKIVEQGGVGFRKTQERNSLWSKLGNLDMKLFLVLV